VKLLETGPAGAATTLILAHGAGAPMDSPFLETIAEGLAATGIRVVRFEFPYMAERRASGKRGAPDREPVLLDAWREAIATVGRPKGARLAIGGKSLGGRMASKIADEAEVDALVCLGYPFHPPGKPERVRTAHLAELRTPTLVLQGTRDPFGKPDDVAGYELSPAIRVHWIEDGDHSLVPPKRSTRTEAGNLAEAVGEIAAFLAGLG